MNLIIKKIIIAIRYNWRQIVIFEIVYRTLQIWGIAKLGTIGLQFALKKAEYSYLTSGNLLNFISQPYTWGIILVLLIVFVLSLGFEVSVQVSVYQASLNGKKIGALEMLARGFEKNRKFFSKDGIIIILLFMGTWFLYSLFPIIRLGKMSKPLVSLLKEAKHLGIYIAAAVFIFALLFIIPNIFASVGYLIEHITRKEAGKNSLDIIKRVPFKAVVLQLLINIVLTIGIIFIYFVFIIGASVIIAIFAESNYSFAMMQVAGNNIELFLIVMGSILYSVVNNAFLTVSYCEHTFIKSEEDVYKYDIVFWSKVRKSQTIIIGIIAMITYVIVVVNGLIDAFGMARVVFGETFITAHRGSSVAAPENTLEAVQLAIDEFSDYVEIDLQETKDGVVIVFHDNNLKRITGINENVWNLDYSEIKLLNASGIHKDKYPYVVIPTFEEVLALCKGKIRINIELKDTKRGQNLPAKTVELVEEYQMEQYCVVTSTSRQYLSEIKELNSEIKTGYIILAGYGNYFNLPEVDFISIRSSFVSKNLMQEAHKNGKEVHAWTVNTKAELERLKLLSVDNIITSKPAYAREILFQEAISIGIFEYIKQMITW
jgi:Glycerophosphoryl diester phosphodiesterase